MFMSNLQEESDDTIIVKEEYSIDELLVEFRLETREYIEQMGKPLLENFIYEAWYEFLDDL
jgi:hypothetical protein